MGKLESALPECKEVHQRTLPCEGLRLQRLFFFFFFQAEDGIRDLTVTGVQTCALPISPSPTANSRCVKRVASPKSFPPAPAATGTNSSNRPSARFSRATRMRRNSIPVVDRKSVV